jgi:DNA-binding protein Fis
MTLNKKHTVSEPAEREKRTTPAAVAEEILEKKLEDIATILCKSETDRSRLYDEVLTMVERGLVRIALRRSNHVKSAAAAYLGINRNTFQKKMVILGIDHDQK